jgi:hypothetical protein
LWSFPGGFRITSSRGPSRDCKKDKGKRYKDKGKAKEDHPAGRDLRDAAVEAGGKRLKEKAIGEKKTKDAGN